MKPTISTKRKRGAQAAWDGSVFRITKGTRSLIVPVVADPEADMLVELDALTHWEAIDAPAGDAASPEEAAEVSIEELQEILEAIEQEAERQGLSIDFE